MEQIQTQINALQVITTGQLPKMSDGQIGLLRIIRKCVEDKKPLAFELIVRCYYDNVRKFYYRSYGWDFEKKDYTGYHKLDIWEMFTGKETRSNFGYSVKPSIRQWFVSTIGILVVKNQLVVIPTIEID